MTFPRSASAVSLAALLSFSSGSLLAQETETGSDGAEATAAPEAEALAAAGTEPFAPIPETAQGPAIPQDKGYLVEDVQDGLYWVTDGTYLAMFLTTGEGVIAVDAPPSLGENYLKAIAEVTDEPVTHVIYSHAHADHIGAAGLFPDDAEYIAHQDTADLLAQVNDPNRPLPTQAFEDSHTVEVGDQTLVLDYHGVNHEPGNIFIHAPEQRVLMLVDVIFPGWVPFKNLAVSDFIPGFEAAHDQVLEYEFDTFIGGHLTRPGTREDVEVQREFIQDLKAAATEALGSVDFMAVAQETGFENPWELFDRYLDAVALECTETMLPKWTGRLGGADVFMPGHCWTMMESLRIDYGIQ